MITSKLYPTNQTVAETNIELTKIVSEIDSPLPNIGEPYYMGYVKYENFPRHFNLNIVEISEGGDSITFTPIEENHSWGYIKQAGAGSFFGGTPQLYAYKSDDSIYEYDTSSDAHCRFINQIKMANVNTFNSFQLNIHGIFIKTIYLEQIMTAQGSFSFYQNSNPDATSFDKTINLDFENLKKLLNNEKISFEITFNSNNYTIEFNKDDYINDTVVKVQVDTTYTAYLSIVNFNFDGRSEYYNNLGSGTTMTITPFFSQTIPEDHEATGIVAQHNAVWVPHNIDIGDSRFRYNYYISTFSNIYASYEVVGMTPGNFPLGTLTINEFEAAGFSGNYDGMIEETMFLVGTGGVDYGDEHYYGYRYYSQINVYDILSEVSNYNKWYFDALGPSATYTDAYFASIYNENDEPEGLLWNGNYPQDQDFSDKLRPWQIPGQVITVDNYDPADIPPFDPGGGGDDPVAPPNSGVSGDSFTKGTVYRLPRQNFVNYGAFNAEMLGALETHFWNQPDNFFESIAAAQKVNPLDYFISLRYYPFDFSAFGDTRRELLLGRGGELTLSEINTYTLLDRTHFTYGFGSIYVKPHYKNFLDYAPYTKVYINLPFCGQLELNSTLVMGKTIDLGATVDITDGSIFWTVNLVEGEKAYPLISKQGKIGADIPLTGVNASQMGANMTNASLRIAGHLLNAPNKIMDAAAQVSEGLALGNSKYLLPGLQTIGGLGLQALGDCYSLGMASKEIIEKLGPSSGYAALAEPTNKTPFLIYQRPISENPKSYGETIGYLVNKKAKIDDVSGFTICKNPKIKIKNATENEIGSIKQLLESGFYA